MGRAQRAEEAWAWGAEKMTERIDFAFAAASGIRPRSAVATDTWPSARSLLPRPTMHGVCACTHATEVVKHPLTVASCLHAPCRLARAAHRQRGPGHAATSTRAARLHVWSPHTRPCTALPRFPPNITAWYTAPRIRRRASSRKKSESRILYGRPLFCAPARALALLPPRHAPVCCSLCARCPARTCNAALDGAH